MVTNPSIKLIFILFKLGIFFFFLLNQEIILFIYKNQFNNIDNVF